MNPLERLAFHKPENEREASIFVDLARIRAACGWTVAYHGSCIDPTYLSHTFDPPPEPPKDKSPSPSDYFLKRISKKQEREGRKGNILTEVKRQKEACK